MKDTWRLRGREKNTVYSIVNIFGVTAIAGGLFIISPFLHLTAPGGASAVYATAASSFGLWGIAIAAILSGLIMLIGAWKDNKQLASHGVLLNIILRVYLFIIATLVYGFSNSFITTLTLIGILVVIYITLRRNR